MVQELIPNFPSGPLDKYRKNATFDWKKLKIFIETEEIIKFTNELYEELKQRPLLYSNSISMKLDELRHDVTKKVSSLQTIPIVELYDIDKPKQFALSATLFNLDPSAAIKMSATPGLFGGTVLFMGTDRHFHFVQDALARKISGCFCLTEIGHGSNARGMRTTATYNPLTKEFVLNSPDFQAAKCWAGNLGQTATHAVVFAQLTTPDGVQRGLHAFIVPLRDTNTLIPFPGVIVGDMGEKAGLNGLDNGFVMFDNYRIPRKYLLNKNADVNEAGKYIRAIKDPSRMHGASLGALTTLRIGVVHLSYIYLTKALTIAIRYAGVRRQFGPEGEEELPIIEYQLHQHRLLPYLAAVYHLRFLAEDLIFGSVVKKAHNTNNTALITLGSEVHALSSAAKPISGWIARDGIQECREACGGHGYLKAAGICDVRNDNDANCTYDGENHVLIQQTSNWLLTFWPQVLKRQQISSPLNSIDFLSSGLQILNTKFKPNNIAELVVPENIISIYEWLVCYLLKITYEKHQANVRKGMDNFTARNENQVFYSRSLGIAYIQHYTLNVMYSKIQEASDPAIKRILEKLLALHGLFTIEKQFTSVLYQGGYTVTESPVFLIQEAILWLCREIKGDAVALVDVIAPPDFLLKSALGASDGQVYHHLQSSFYQSPHCMSRPNWWKDMTDKSNVRPKM